MFCRVIFQLGILITIAMSKCLFFFDCSQTITSGLMYPRIMEFVNDKTLKTRFMNVVDELQRFSLINEALKYLQERNIGREAIDEKLKEIDFVEGMKEVLKYIEENSDKYECIIISDGNDWFIESCLKNIDCETIPKVLITNRVIFDDNDRFVTINPCHSHNHASCVANMCKGKLLREYVEKFGQKYERVVFVGDGGNDYCACKELSPHDGAFARRGYELHKRLTTPPTDQPIKCEVFVWENGFDIIEKIKSFK